GPGNYFEQDFRFRKIILALAGLGVTAALWLENRGGGLVNLQGGPYYLGSQCFSGRFATSIFGSSRRKNVGARDADQAAHDNLQRRHQRAGGGGRLGIGVGRMVLCEEKKTAPPAVGAAEAGTVLSERFRTANPELYYPSTDNDRLILGRHCDA